MLIHFKWFYISTLKDGEKAGDLQGEAWQSESETERVYTKECTFENHTYHVGDFVYVEQSKPNLKPHIVCIERLWENEAGTIHNCFFEFNYYKKWF